MREVLDYICCAAITKARQHINQYKETHNLISFDDIITSLHTAVVESPNPLLLERLRQKYKAVFIDEFQDTNKCQYQIFDALYGEGTILFYIGDPKQSIFGFQQADLFTYFQAAAATKNQYSMDENYRSSKRLIEAMNHFFKPSTSFDTFSFGGQKHAIDYHPVRFPAMKEKGELYKGADVDTPITLFKCANQKSIRETVVAQVLELLQDSRNRIKEKGEERRIKPSDIGIIVRNNSQAKEMKKELAEYGIPAVTVDDTKVLKSEEARMVLYLLQAFQQPSPSTISRALLSPLSSFQPETISKLNYQSLMEKFSLYQIHW
ncbi:MAG: hypothetical protein EOP48_28075, partial [Sphingobacteriales bacterium]